MIQESSNDPVYHRLAQCLDALPNRFPSTASGVEVRLLKKVFTLEEATLASFMSLTPEPAGVIAARAGVEPRAGRDTLKRMGAKGLADVRRGEGEFAFALKPFVVGFYEAQLPRMDAEMAALFEEYFKETRGGILRDAPAHHRVIPIEQAIKVQIDIQPYDCASKLLEEASSWGVRDCICRVQQRLIGKGCDRPVKSCLVFSHHKNAFDRSTVDRALTKEEALQILRATEDAGLVHTVGNFREGVDYICNCCTCCCGILRGVAEFGIMSSVARSDYRIVLDADSCSGCGNCIERCQFHAIVPADSIVAVDDMHCMGCGVCVESCPSDSLSLERRPSGEVTAPPADIADWRSKRLSAPR